MRPRDLLAGPLGGALFTGSSTTSAADYTSHAAKAIDTLNQQWYNVSTGIWDDAWWNSANVLTTIADFTILSLDQANNLNLGGYMHNTFIQAQKTPVYTEKAVSEGRVSTKDTLGDKGAVSRRDHLSERGYDDFINEYYDDEGWWALGLIRAFDATGDLEYIYSAVTIFEDMQTGLGGPCNGGIYWNKQRKYVNAIANELYLMIAASLANRYGGDKHYLDIAKGQWEWFKNSGMINKDNLINDGLNDDCKNNGMQTWSYNQGVILGGLTELYMATGEQDLLREAHTIAKAAIDHLSNDDGILVETDKCELRAGNCGRDGQQFKGVFMRNLRYLNQVAPDDKFGEFILRNADSIWSNNRNDEDMLGVAWNGPYVKATGASQSCALDVIVAAIAVAS